MSKRSRPPVIDLPGEADDDAAHDLAVKRARRTIADFPQFSQFFPELKGLVASKLPLSELLDLLQTHKAFHTVELQNALWYTLCDVEYRSPITGNEYRYLTNAKRLFTRYSDHEALSDDARVTRGATYWREVYWQGSMVIRVLLIVLQRAIRPVLTQTREATLRLLPQWDREWIQAVAKADDTPVTYVNHQRNDYIALTATDRVGVDRSQPIHIVRPPAYTVDRNNWLAIGDTGRRIAARVGRHHGPLNPGIPKVIQWDLYRPVFAFTPERAVLLTRSLQHIPDLPIFRSQAGNRVPPPHDEPVPIEDTAGNQYIPRIFDITAKNTIIVRAPWNSHGSWIYLTQPCRDGLRLEVGEDMVRPWAQHQRIALVGTPTTDGRDEVLFRLGDRPVMTGIARFGYQVADSVIDQSDITIHRALFVRRIDIDGVVDWLRAQSGITGFGGLLSFVRIERTELTEATTPTRLSEQVRQDIVSYWRDWRLAYGGFPDPNTRLTEPDPVARAMLFLVDDWRVLLELAVRDLDDVAADLTLVLTQPQFNPWSQLMNLFEPATGVGLGPRIHYMAKSDA